MSAGVKRRVVVTVMIAVIAIVALISRVRGDPFDTGTPLVATGDEPVDLLDDDFSVDPLPSGWVERTFWRVQATDYSIVDLDGDPALRCSTDSSGSILARDTSIDIGERPILSWRWKVDRPIVSTLDEETREGDDHPARFFLRFESDDGRRIATEIIWSNRKYRPGDYKIIDGFHHLVANGLNKNVGRWHDQRVDLQQLYSDISGRADVPELDVLGFFCDSDNAGGSSDAYFRDVVLSRR